MSETLLIALLNFAVKFGIDAALAIAKSIGVNSTIDDAIAALEAANQKTAKQYIAEAKPEIPPTPQSAK